MSLHFYRLHTILFFLTILWSSGFAQEEPLSISEWKALLSVKEDIGAVNLTKALQKITTLDSVQYCETMTRLWEQAGRKNIRLQIRLSLIQSSATYSKPHCPKHPQDVQLLKKALLQAFEIDDNLLAVEVYRSLADESYVNGKIGFAVVYFNAAKELMETEGLERFHLYPNNSYALEICTTDPEITGLLYQCITRPLHYKGNPAIHRKDTLDRYWKMNMWNVIGLSYKRLGIIDSAFYALEKAYGFADQDFWKGLIKGNRGDLFYLQERYDSAEVLLKVDYKESLDYGEWDNAAITLQRLAHITNTQGEHVKALSMIKKADSLERIAPNWEYRAGILQTYALIYRDLGHADSVYDYLEKYKALKDLIERKATDNRYEIAQLQFDNQNHVEQIRSLKKDRSRILLIRNFSIAMIIVLTVLGYLYINRIRLKAKLRQQEVLADKLKAEAEAEQALAQLQLFTTTLRERTQQLDDLQSRITQKELDQEQIENIEQLTQHTILTDEDWDRFRNLFTKVHPGFFISLKRDISDITIAEQRMAALIKLQISNKDSASMLGVSQNSIYKTRQRLRQRLGLNHDADLDTYFLERLA